MGKYEDIALTEAFLWQEKGCKITYLTSAKECEDYITLGPACRPVEWDFSQLSHFWGPSGGERLDALHTHILGEDQLRGLGYDSAIVDEVSFAPEPSEPPTLREFSTVSKDPIDFDKPERTHPSQDLGTMRHLAVGQVHDSITLQVSGRPEYDYEMLMRIYQKHLEEWDASSLLGPDVGPVDLP